ncbi:MAG: ATP-binding protein [Dehalococcoidia bacterium]|nr:ATP-binding protein [Dehalococcoidia bacterium]
MGLAIVRKIINKHGGDIWANSVESQGATFHFALPNKFEHRD